MSAALGAVPLTGLPASDPLPSLRESGGFFGDDADDLDRPLPDLLRELGALLRELVDLPRELGALLRELVDLPREDDELRRDEPDDLDRPLSPELFEPDDEDRPPDFRLSAIPSATIPPVPGPRAGFPRPRGADVQGQLAKV